MKLSLRVISVLCLVVLASPAVLLPACGSDSHETSASAGGSITITSGGIDTIEMTVGLGSCDGAQTAISDQPVLVTVLDADGAPLNDITIFVGLDWSPSTSTAVAMRLIDTDLNPPVEVSVPYKTKTRDHGTKNLVVRMDIGGCEYAGQLSVTSGTLSSSMNIEVTAE
jgi:hypothetical protein